MQDETTGTCLQSEKLTLQLCSGSPPAPAGLCPLACGLGSTRCPASLQCADSIARFAGRECLPDLCRVGADLRRVSLRDSLAAGARSVLGFPFARKKGKRPVKYLRSLEWKYSGKARKRPVWIVSRGGPIHPPMLFNWPLHWEESDHMSAEPLRRRGLQNAFFPSLELMKLKLSWMGAKPPLSKP